MQITILIFSIKYYSCSLY